MNIAAGTMLGPYEIISPLGAGGMGEVYRARDTRLNREVAIKVLPASFANDEDRLRRFEQEARATSALNHPNILTVYDIGTASPKLGGAPYIVAELLEGEELRDQLNHGAISPRGAIEYATQIASGLAAAHAKAIVHRDLKPENIFLTTDGRVKILDFGLAKLRPQSSALGSSSDVQTQKAITDPGVVMGTVGYMSPEQVRGQGADHRSDIFSFGAILHEMLTGRRAFLRETMAETMTAILREEPEEIAQLNNRVPPQLERIVGRCLEKKPERRFQSTSDLCFAIEALSAPSGSSGPSVTAGPRALDAAATTERGGWRDRLAWIIAGVALLVALALGVAYFNRSPADTHAVLLAFAPPENLAFDNGAFDYVIVSPDGQKLVFTGRSADGKKQLWVRPLHSSEAQPLPGTDDPLEPFWSPDSRSIAFGSQGKLKRVDLAGGRPQTLCDASRIGGGTWSRAGVILFEPNLQSGLFQIAATGGEAQPVASPDTVREEITRRDPCFLPDGRHFLFIVDTRDGEERVFAGSLDSKEVKQVMTDGTSAVYAPPGWLLFVRNGALQAQLFDADRLELKGEAFPITRPANAADGVGRFSVSENGVLIWQGDQEREYQLVWFDREGKQGGTAGPPKKVWIGEAPRLSPDGKRVAIQRVDPQTRNMDIWVIDLTRNLPTRLTSDPANDQLPIWSPDGSRVVFESNKGGVNGLYQKAASDGGNEELLLKVGDCAPTTWSARRQLIIYNTRVEKTRRDVWALPLTGDRQPYPLLNSDFDEYRAQLSPDGRWLAYASDESGSYEVYLQTFSADGKLRGDKVRISTSGGNQPRWRRNGQELFYVATDWQMMAVAVKTGGATFEFDTPKRCSRRAC